MACKKCGQKKGDMKVHMALHNKLDQCQQLTQAIMKFCETTQKRLHDDSLVKEKGEEAILEKLDQFLQSIPSYDLFQNAFPNSKRHDSWKVLAGILS